MVRIWDWEFLLPPKISKARSHAFVEIWRTVYRGCLILEKWDYFILFPNPEKKTKSQKRFLVPFAVPNVIDHDVGSCDWIALKRMVDLRSPRENTCLWPAQVFFFSICFTIPQKGAQLKCYQHYSVSVSSILSAGYTRKTCAVLSVSWMSLSRVFRSSTSWEKKKMRIRKSREPLPFDLQGHPEKTWWNMILYWGKGAWYHDFSKRMGNSTRKPFGFISQFDRRWSEYHGYNSRL